ncbi:hypothetical protein BH10CYA1_BH10CYA1_48670 [soil metagenome]
MATFDDPLSHGSVENVVSKVTERLLKELHSQVGDRIASISPSNQAQDSARESATKVFGALALGDINQDKKTLGELYDTVSPGPEASDNFSKRLESLAKEHPEFIEKILAASKEVPKEAGTKIADALCDLLKARFPNGTGDFSKVQDEFGLAASMVRIVAGNDNSPAGKKEQLVNAFNAELGLKWQAGEKSLQISGEDADGRKFVGSPLLVLYSDKDRSPATVLLPSNGSQINPLHYPEN